MNILDELFPDSLQKRLGYIADRIDEIQEIRVRIGNPITFIMGGTEYYITEEGQVTRLWQYGTGIKKKDMEEMVLHICQSSLYAYEEEIRKGYITLKGGHRVGLLGQAVFSGNGELQTIKNIAFLNIRIAHEVKGVADKALETVCVNGMIKNTLIVSPPGYGKTTLLRDLIRQISNGSRYGEGKNCSVIDERSELAGCYNGIPQLDIGMRTDVLDACPKSIGMMMVIRSMAPKVVAVDELGTAEDIRAVFSVIRSGCSILATIHGDNLYSLQEKSFLREVMEEKVFQTYLVIKNRNHEVDIFDRDLQLC